MYACEAHIDYVMEDFIDQYQVAPTMELISDEELNCSWCDNKAQYKLRLEEEDISLAD